jgi:hypothetical protein
MEAAPQGDRRIVGSSEQVAASLKQLAKNLELDRAGSGHMDLRSGFAPSLLRTAGASLCNGKNQGPFDVIDFRFADGNRRT